MKSKSFTMFSGWFAVLAGVFGFLYSVSFVILKNDLLDGLFLLLSGFCAVIVMTALFQYLREQDPYFALLAFLFSAGAAAGSMIHGGFDLSNALHPPASLPTDVPSPIDPRGLLTFGLAAAGLFFFSQMMAKDSSFPAGLSTLGYVSAVLMLILYLGRLIILQATSPAIGIPALLEGFLVNPIWYLWLASAFLRAKKA